MSEAHQGQVISSHYKDKYYSEHLKSLIIDFISAITKEKAWMRHIKEVSVVADVVYFAFTTLSGSQTMGEEYNNILPVNKDKRSLPGRFKSALMLVFHVILPHTIERSTTYLSNLTQRNQDISDASKQKILIVLKTFSGILKMLEKLNSMLFYLNGAYYHISKRLTSVLYLQTRPLKFDSAYNKTYSLLGWLMLLQSLIASCTYMYNAWKSSNSNLNLFLYNLLGVTIPPSSTHPSTHSAASSLTPVTSYLLRNVTKASSNQATSRATPQHKPPHQHQPNSTQDEPSSTHQPTTPEDTNIHSTKTSTTPQSTTSIYNKNNTSTQQHQLKRRSCLLCCEHLHSPTSTLCGHVFCYQCITQWCLEKPECPVCKQDVQLSRLVFLKNFV